MSPLMFTASCSAAVLQCKTLTHISPAQSRTYTPTGCMDADAERISVRGNQLVDEKGQLLKLHGINYFG